MFYLFQLAMPGTPFIYYGDELGMKTMPLDSKDGGYQRTGVRIPMVWDNESINHGFSKTKGETYLSFYDLNTASVETAIKDKGSLYAFIKKMISLRKEIEDLRSDKLLINGKDRVMKISRGDHHEIILNLTNEDIKLDGEVLVCSKDIQDNILKPYAGALITNK